MNGKCRLEKVKFTASGIFYGPLIYEPLKARACTRILWSPNVFS